MIKCDVIQTNEVDKNTGTVTFLSEINLNNLNQESKILVVYLVEINNGVASNTATFESKELPFRILCTQEKAITVPQVNFASPFVLREVG